MPANTRILGALRGKCTAVEDSCPTEIHGQRLLSWQNRVPALGVLPGYFLLLICCILLPAVATAGLFGFQEQINDTSMLAASVTADTRPTCQKFAVEMRNVPVGCCGLYSCYRRMNFQPSARRFHYSGTVGHICTIRWHPKIPKNVQKSNSSLSTPMKTSEMDKYPTYHEGNSKCGPRLQRSLVP